MTQRGVLVFQGDACAILVFSMERKPLRTLVRGALQQRLRDNGFEEGNHTLSATISETNI